MPVPGGDIDHDSLRLDRLVHQPGRSRRVDQRKDAASQVDRVGRKQQVRERTARARIHEEAMSPQDVATASNCPARKPRPSITVIPSQGKPCSSPNETPGIDLTGASAARRAIARRANSIVTLLNNSTNVFTSSSVHGRRSVIQSAGIRVGLRVKRGQPFAHEQCAGEAHEQHENGRQSQHQSQPRPAQALAVIERATTGAVVSIAPAAVRRRTPASRIAGSRDFDCKIRGQGRHTCFWSSAMLRSPDRFA